MKVKIKLLYLFIIGILHYNSEAQNLQITYGISSSGLLSEEQKQEVSSATLNYFKKAEENYKYVNFIMNISGDRCDFELKEIMMREGVSSTATSPIQIGFNGRYFSEAETGESLHQWDGYGQTFLISSSLNKLEWQISRESKMVVGFKTYKATAEETYETGSGKEKWIITAWFAPEINKPFGPGGYGGLPGLILELERARKIYTAKEIKKVEPVEILKPKKVKKLQGRSLITWVEK